MAVAVMPAAAFVPVFFSMTAAFMPVFFSVTAAFVAFFFSMTAAFVAFFFSMTAAFMAFRFTAAAALTFVGGPVCILFVLAHRQLLFSVTACKSRAKNTGSFE